MTQCEEFDRDNAVIESALTQLLHYFPHNKETSHVLLKVVTINKLYSTNILAVERVSHHIVSKDIDRLLTVGSPEAVDLIAEISA